MKLAAKGLKPVLDAFFPRVMAAVSEGVLEVAQGVRVRIPDDTEVEITDHGPAVHVALGQALLVQIDKSVGPFGLGHVHATEKVTGLMVDASGIDVSLEGWKSPVRLEAMP